jgi:hypothetical protein
MYPDNHNLASIRAERESRFGALHLPEDFITPNYGGRSIVNIPASLVAILGGRHTTPPLEAELLGVLASGVRRVVLVIVDALGYDFLNRALEANSENGFHTLLKNGGRLAPLTSVFPSTTTAALTSLWSGYTPAEHGSLGFQLFLRGPNLRANMIKFQAAALHKLGGEQLPAAGVDPDKFLPVPALPQTLARFGVPTFNLIEQPYENSPLSRMQIRGVKETRGFVTSSDMWLTLRKLMEDRPTEKALFVAYWSAVDTIAHAYGPGSQAIESEVQNLAYSFEREFLRPLASAARQDTLFLLTADHGHAATPPQGVVFLNKHPFIRERMVMDYAGEPRAAYLYCTQGEVEPVRQYFAERLADKFFVLEARTALEAGLFGPPPFAPETRYRVGDLIVLARDHYTLWERDDVPRVLGRHGGLSETEMLVPLLAARLDS